MSQVALICLLCKSVNAKIEITTQVDRLKTEGC